MALALLRPLDVLITIGLLTWAFPWMTLFSTMYLRHGVLNYISCIRFICVDLICLDFVIV